MAIENALLLFARGPDANEWAIQWTFAESLGCGELKIIRVPKTTYVNNTLSFVPQI